MLFSLGKFLFHKMIQTQRQPDTKGPSFRHEEFREEQTDRRTWAPLLALGLIVACPVRERNRA
jgi:hypothetical protein